MFFVAISPIRTAFCCYNNGVVLRFCIIIVALQAAYMSNNICLQGGRLMENKVEVLSTVRLQYSGDLYKVVDALNRTLKEKDLMFGLALDKENNDTAIFTIYRT